MAWYEVKTSSGGGSGTNDYNALINQPRMNGNILKGNKTTEELIPIGNGLEIDDRGRLSLSFSETTNPSGGTTVVIGS